MLYINTIAQNIIVNDPPATAYQSTVDQVFNNIDGETASSTVITNLVGTVVFAFDPLFNPPKNANEVDAFLFNDAVRISNITGQGHGGFMFVNNGRMKDKAKPSIKESYDDIKRRFL
jgi:hypothetical protein